MNKIHLDILIEQYILHRYNYGPRNNTVYNSLIEAKLGAYYAISIREATYNAETERGFEAFKLDTLRIMKGVVCPFV